MLGNGAYGWLILQFFFLILVALQKKKITIKFEKKIRKHQWEKKDYFALVLKEKGEYRNALKTKTKKELSWEKNEIIDKQKSFIWKAKEHKQLIEPKSCLHF